MFKVHAVLVAAAMAFCGSAAAWEEGVDHDEPLHCDNLPLGGADQVLVRVKPEGGSFGAPVLIGIKDGAILWRHPFPDANEVNVAKFGATCEGQKITLWSQYPGASPGYNQEYRWDGTELVRVREYTDQVADER